MVADKITAILKSRAPEIIAGNGHKPAAVLIPIQERRDSDYLVLTQRGDHLPTHKGQIAFPGGRVDVSDKDIFHTALRESQEEIGIDPEQVKILGRLDEFTAGYGLVVTPVVGVIPAHCEFRMDPRETTAVASVPIRSLMERRNFALDDRLSPGGHPSYHFYVNDWDVWGVTARILVQFLELAYDFKVKNFSYVSFLLILFAIVSACVSGPHFYLQYGNEYRELDLEKILADNPLAPGENIQVANLGRSASASQHVVQIRDREILHVHKIHDATVTMLRGQGYLVLDNKRLNLKAGDVIHIPRGVAHQYVNTSSEPTVALAVYAPAFDGKDTHPVSQP